MTAGFMVSRHDKHPSERYYKTGGHRPPLQWEGILLIMAATTEATRRYAGKFRDTLAQGHFREQHGLFMSSIGVGTYLGEADEETDANYRHAIVRAVESGANVIDTASNYRFQR